MLRISMKLITGLLAVLLLGMAHAQSEAGDKPYRVFMILWRGETEVERGFKDALAELKLPVEFTIRSADRDRSRIPALVAEAKAARPDLVYTWGTTVTLGVVGEYDRVDSATHIADIPVLFTMVAAPLEARIVPELRSSGRNVTGTTHIVPIETQIKAIRAYRSLTRLGVIYNPAEANSVANIRQLRELSDKLQFELLDQPVPLDEQGNPRADTLLELVGDLARREPQFLYIGPDTFIGDNRQLIIGEAIKHRLPAFSATELEMRDGQAMIGLVSRYYNLGRFTAFKARQILVDHAQPRAIPIETLSRFTYIINMAVAKRLELYPPMNTLNYAEVIE
ncbi:MAG: ABC transporter substrate-binding protein [Gammaproteobacteria bacterium]